LDGGQTPPGPLVLALSVLTLADAILLVAGRVQLLDPCLLGEGGVDLGHVEVSPEAEVVPLLRLGDDFRLGGVDAVGEAEVARGDDVPVPCLHEPVGDLQRGLGGVPDGLVVLFEDFYHGVDLVLAEGERPRLGSHGLLRLPVSGSNRLAIPAYRQVRPVAVVHDLLGALHPGQHLLVGAVLLGLLSGVVHVHRPVLVQEDAPQCALHPSSSSIQLGASLSSPSSRSILPSICQSSAFAYAPSMMSCWYIFSPARTAR